MHATVSPFSQHRPAPLPWHTPTVVLQQPPPQHTSLSMQQVPEQFSLQHAPPSMLQSLKQSAEVAAHAASATQPMPNV